MTIEIKQVDELFINETYESFCSKAETLLGEAEQLLVDFDRKNQDIGELKSISVAISLIKEIGSMFYSVDIGGLDMSEISPVTEHLLQSIGQYESVITAEHVSELQTIRKFLKTEVDKQQFIKPAGQEEVS